MGQTDSKYPASITGYDYGRLKPVAIAPGASSLAAQVEIDSATITVGLLRVDYRVYTHQPIERVLQELAKTSRNDNILQYFVHANRYLFLVMPDAHWSISAAYKTKGISSFIVLRKILHDVLTHLQVLHATGNVHSNIRGDSLLVNKRGEVTLSPLGSMAVQLLKPNEDSKLVNERRLPGIYSASRHWHAPELQTYPKETFTSASDIWSLGILTMELACGSSFYDALTGPSLRETLDRGTTVMGRSTELKRLLSLLEYLPRAMCPSLLRDFVVTCLENDPNKRSDATMLLQHPLFAEEEEGNASASDVMDILRLKINKTALYKYPVTTRQQRLLEKKKRKKKAMMEESSSDDEVDAPFSIDQLIGAREVAESSVQEEKKSKIHERTMTREIDFGSFDGDGGGDSDVDTYANFDDYDEDNMGDGSPDRVSFSAFAPEQVAPQQLFLLYIWAYLPAQKQEVIARAQKTESKSETGATGDVGIERGTEVTLQLVLPDSLQLQKGMDGSRTSDHQSFVWQGDIEHTIFPLECIDALTPSAECTCHVYTHGTRIAVIKFHVATSTQSSYDTFEFSGDEEEEEEYLNSSDDDADVYTAGSGAYDNFDEQNTIAEKDAEISAKRFEKTMSFLKASTQDLNAISGANSKSLQTRVFYINKILACFAQNDSTIVQKWKRKLQRSGSGSPEIDDSILVQRASEGWSGKLDDAAVWKTWDLLQVYWTPQAASDKWVNMEWRAGVRMKNEDFIQILRIDPDEALPPELQRIYIAPPGSSSSEIGSQKPPNSNDELTPDTVTLGALLGKGNFGKVNKAKWNDKTVVIKRIKADKSMTNEDAMNIVMEASVMKRLSRHSNIVQFYSSCLHGDELWLALEFMPQGALEDYLRENSVSWKDKVAIAAQAALALSQCHSDAVIHRDVAARNFLVKKTQDGGYLVKLADFGLSKFQRHSSNFAIDHRGSPLKWLSPEGLLSANFSAQSDVWSLGVVLWEIANDGAEPYPGQTPVQAAKSVAYERARVSLTPSDTYNNIMMKCFAQEPKKRISAAKAHALLEECYQDL